MIAIKGFEEMPNACTSTQEILGDIVVTHCHLYNICKNRHTIRTNYKPSDCPLVEIEEPKVGKWILIDKEKNIWKCTKCIELGKDDWWQLNTGTPTDNKMDYCPHCGAKMGVKNDSN